jgi:hypothetical protein
MALWTLRFGVFAIVHPSGKNPVCASAHHQVRFSPDNCVEPQSTRRAPRKRGECPGIAARGLREGNFMKDADKSLCRLNLCNANHQNLRDLQRICEPRITRIARIISSPIRAYPCNPWFNRFCLVAALPRCVLRVLCGA